MSDQFDPKNDTCESAFNKWMAAGEKLGKYVPESVRFDMWTAWKTAWDSSVEGQIAELTRQNDLLVIQMRAIANAPIGLGAAGGHGMAKWALNEVGDRRAV